MALVKVHQLKGGTLDTLAADLHTLYGSAQPPDAPKDEDEVSALKSVYDR